MTTTLPSREEDLLAKQIADRKARLQAMSAEAETLRQETAAKFHERYAARFADLDVVRALAGQKTEHLFRVNDARYHLQPPVRRVTHEVEKFAMNPGELGPVSSEEGLLLAWLVGVSVEGSPVRPMNALTVQDRILAIRNLPEIMLAKLSDECQLVQAYLNVCLERELGNS